ncbi:MAG: hypothetical protein WC635_09750 [Bacteriovorax sp.]
MKALLALFLVTFSLSSVSAKECPPGKLFGKEDAYEFIASTKQLSAKTYTEDKSSFIKGVRLEQIKRALNVKSINDAFSGVDEGMIHKFEIAGNERTSYDSLTVIYAYRGEVIVGAVFPDDSSVVWARLQDSAVRVCDGL